MLIRCRACRGTKKIQAMGGIYKDCETCKAVGYIEQLNEPQQSQSPTLAEVIASKDNELQQAINDAVSDIDKPKKLTGNHTRTKHKPVSVIKLLQNTSFKRKKRTPKPAIINE